MTFKKNNKTHPGGLVLYDLPEFPKINNIYYLLADKKLDTLEGTEKVLANEVIRSLMLNPTNIYEYCEKHSAYNMLNYAAEKIKYRDITCDCVVVPRKNGRTHFLTVTKEFKEKAEPKEGTLIQLVLKPSKQIYLVTIKAINQMTFDFDFNEKDCVSSVKSKCTITIMPSTFNFCSWNRTIQQILDGTGVSSDFIFPKVSNYEISENDYKKAEKELLRTLNFTKNTFNTWQKRAIAGILLRSSVKIPYVLFGPPGTGKTTTLVEAVIQLVRQNPTNRVLICTPSNSAADHFALTLMRTGKVERKLIFRVYSSSHSPDDKDADILPITESLYSEIHGRVVFGIPKANNLQRDYRIFVMTLSCSSYFVSARLKGMFSHIIVDEAGQAQEIETLVPISGLGDSNTRFVLAGDPKQLGPVETIQMAKHMNLNISMLERFINISFYKDEDRRFMCMLKDNYRSHKALVDLPSSMNYNGKLVAAVPVSQRNSLCKWAHLPKQGFPMFWHSIRGGEAREQNGTSYQNVKEAELVICYVDLLLQAGVKTSEIGIVTPYKCQVKYLREKLAHLADELTIDSVEKYQGSERRVIIVSTVRCKSMGFLACNKRLNTTITRAKELLILIGDHANMATDRNWRRVIEYCQKNDALVKEVSSTQHQLMGKLCKEMSTMRMRNKPSGGDFVEKKCPAKKGRKKMKSKNLIQQPVEKKPPNSKPPKSKPVQPAKTPAKTSCKTKAKKKAKRPRPKNPA